MDSRPLRLHLKRMKTLHHLLKKHNDGEKNLLAIETTHCKNVPMALGISKSIK